MNKKANGTLTLVFYLIGFLFVFFGFIVPLINATIPGAIETFGLTGIFALAIANWHIIIIGVVILVLIAASGVGQ